MYLQRLIADEDIGLNYDYMGSAEFLGSGTSIARARLAKLQISGELTCRKVRLFISWGRSTVGPVEVFVFGSKEYLDQIITAAPSTKVISDLILRCDKENARINDASYLGWLKIEPYNAVFEPLLILRPDNKTLELGNKYLQPFMDQILAAEKKADQSPIYTYLNGWTLRRAEGPIILPQNDGIPIEAGGQWVLFNDKNEPVDRDKYFTDITDRHWRKIGDPIEAED